MKVNIPPMYSSDGSALTLEYEGAIDVYGLLGQNCHIFKDAEACTNVMDSLNHIVHGITNYTPRMKTRTIEDATTARWDIIQYLIQHYKYTTYLEIGCAGDEVFNRTKDSVALAIGVDPSKGGTHRMSSDEFFKNNIETFDVIFIDGDHNAKQAIIDVHNALAILNEGGTIVLHDCNPRVELRQIPHDNPNHTYNGDVWKVALSLRLRSDLEIVIIDVDHGMGVVRRRPNLHPLPAEFAERLRAAENVLEAFTYQDLDAHREEFLRLVSVAEYRDWLAEV